MTAAQVAGFEYVVMDVYARRSFDKDGTTIHEDEQAEECIERIEETPGWVLGKVFKDHALSAWKPGVVRPDFEELMKRLESGESNGLLVWDLTRFTRKPLEGERLVALADRGLLVASLSTVYNLRTADGRMEFRNKVSRNAHESDTISDRSRRGMRLKAKRGKSLATQRGFGRDGYLPRPKRKDGQPDTDAMRVRVPEEQLAAERAAVQDAARRILAGEPMAVIAEEWNEAGLRTIKGGLWDSGIMRHMLQSPAVGGLVAHKPTGAKAYKITADNEDGPLDRDTWQALMDHFDSRRRGRPASVYLLSGLLVCAECGSKLYGRPRKDRRQYWCQIRTVPERSGCARVFIDVEWADRQVRAMVMDRLNDPKAVERLAKVQAKVEAEYQRLRAERDRINEAMDNLAAKVDTTARWTQDRVDLAMANYEPKLEDVERRIKELDADPEGFAKVNVAADWDAPNATDSDRRLLIKRAYPRGLLVTRAPNSKPESLTPDRISPRELVVVPK